MKQKLLNKLWLRVGMIVAIMTTALSGTVWAETASFAPSNFSGQGTSGSGSAISATVDGVTFACNKGYGTTQIRCYSGGKITISSSNTITAISFTFSGSYTGGLETSYTNLSTTSWEKTLSSQARITEITVTYTSDTPAYTINAQSNNNNYGTVSLSGSVITASPASGYTYADPAYTVNPANSATVEQNGNKFTVTPTENTTVTINFEAIPKHTVTFSVNGVTTSTELIEGADINFPDDPESIDDKVFRGWVATSIDGTTNVEPTFVTSATMGEGDVTYYAVFADVIPGTSELVNDKLTRATTGVTGTSYSNWSGKTATSDAVYAGNSAGGNGSIQLRSTDNSGLVTTTSGGKVKNIIVTWNASTTAGRTINIYGKNSAYEAASDLYNNNKQGTLLGTLAKGSTTLAVTGDYEYVGIRSASGALYLEDITITWEAGTPDTYSDYCTTVVVSNVEKPVIEVAANPFLFSTTATITCETVSATIYYSFNGENWTVYEGPLTITESKTIYAKAALLPDESKVVSVDVIKNLAPTAVAVSGDLTLDLAGETNVDAGTLTASVTYNDAAVDGATVTWSSSNPEVATIDETGAVTLLTTGEVTFTATYDGDSDYAEATGTKTITIIDSTVPGTVGNPYTVAQARDAIDANAGVTGVYATGIVSQIVTAYNSQYGNITFDIIDEGGSNTLRAYRCTGTEASNVQVGDIVVVSGDLTLYNSIYEFTQGCQLVSLTHNTTPNIVIAETIIDASCAVNNGTINVTYENFTAVLSEVIFCDVNGSDATYDWITAVINNENNVEYHLNENTGEARTAYMKVYALDDEANEVYSGLITVTQAAYVPPFESTTWTLASSITSGKHYIIVNKESSKAMGAQNTNNRAAADVIINDNNNTVTVSSADVQEFVIYGPDADAYYTIYDASTPGYLYAVGGTSNNHLKTESTPAAHGHWTINFDNDGKASIVANISGRNTMRFNSSSSVFSCYASGQEDIYLYEKDGEATPTESKTLNGSGYATYCSKNALDFTGNSDVTAWAITAANSSTGVITFSQIEGKVPAGTGMLLKGSASAPVNITSATGTVAAPSSNLLEGLLASKNVAADQYYGLSGNEFVKVNAGIVPAGKALLPASVLSSSVKAFTFVFEDDATGIEETLSNSPLKGENIYNLAGQMVNGKSVNGKLPKGIYIVNGKKIMVK